MNVRTTEINTKTPAMDVSLFAPSSYTGSSRYLRRKKREYMHEVVTAAEIARKEKISNVEVEENEPQEEGREEAMAEEEEEEEEEYMEEDSSAEHSESQAASPMQTWDQMKDQTSSIEEGSLVQEDCTLEETKDNPSVEHSEPEALSAEKELVQSILETGAQKQQTLGVEQASLVESRPVEANGGPTAKQSELEPMSPDRMSVHSPLETTVQTKIQTSVIEPTPEKSAPPAAVASKPKKNVARGIAQSSSSASTRKRMISFSPERAPRPENRALALKKLEKNLKTNEKLQMRLEAPTPVKAHAPSRMSSPVVPTQTRRPINFQSPQARRPMSFQSPQSRRPTFQSPTTAASCSIQLSQTEELVYDATQELEEDTPSVVVVIQAASTTIDGAITEEKDCVTSGHQDHFVADEDYEAVTHSQDVVCLSQESTSLAPTQDEKIALLSQESCNSMASLAEADDTVAHTDISFSAFTSTSVIGDVGLFNCETDVEYTGGVYGEGTDGKVSAAVINGQKVALKRAKPHEGFPIEEAKHRSALELHYLRRVRHAKGFLQCLGLCDGIEHTCIALEVMDCKLSDYLRRYGVNSGGSKHRRYTLSFEDTKAMLKQICLPMITLHDEINVAHGDLACRNILLRTPPEGYEKSWEPDIKLSDFGRIKLPSDEPKILDSSFSFHKNCDVGAFGREILYRLLVGEIVPKEYVETRSLHKMLQDVTVTQVPEAAKARLGPYYSLFLRCTAWGVRPTFREVYEHLDDLEYFETIENGLFPLKPTGAVSTTDSTFMSPEVSRKPPSSSASRIHKRDTPSGPNHRPSGPKSRLFSSKSFTEANVSGPNKTVNWLKTRSVGAQRQQISTPNALPMLLKKKKTPPSAAMPLMEVAADDVEQCKLLSNAASYAIQALLGVIAIGTLWYKRHVERPRRPLQIWFMDVGKQTIGASTGHFINLLVSVQMPPVTDECAWYFLNFLSDCTFGMVVSLAFLRLQQELAFSMNWVNIQESGDYGNPPSYRVWVLQLMAWLVIIVISKAIVVSVMIAGVTPIGLIGELLFHSLRGYPFAELLLVMVVCPSFLNVVQFWIQDSFLKRDVSVLPMAYARFRHSFEESLQTNLLSHSHE
ncbi:hypothetical protein BBO99_00002887 [Phytophthora kernoviae]|uniref:Protein kinase domain-containing protein n=2 Tax=Phytophthora kernoviae TaxID=325452 RepID=A0A3R7J8Q2_9STRA|nr:hypothetical protein G195_004517 [Phytophthora kernoviae 00238/432]KAG2523816.1 hypothetical protein JM16_002297 [Phytophthora kernoviae]KAG2525626.1 hypothetical protein JM18_002363 [Phytophthora kernoviae]RLN38160.1 hypothetical protein BBI17_002879 [Phytophthora kernoviae]RLN82450.1 hypothetical protein BBO99_00002887 [Phytophthora kernoviae]